VSLTRRRFMQSVGAGAAGSLFAPALAGRGLEALAAGDRRALTANAIRLNSNENPDGPGRAALDGIAQQLSEASRYPFGVIDSLRAATATALGIAPGNILLTCGSTDILRASVYAFTSPTAALVTGRPSFESPGEDAAVVGAPVHAVPLTADLHLDLPAMLAVSRGAGLIYLCNPNNPTATVHGADAVKDFIAAVLKDSPQTTILVDEAYHEYVEDPRYATMIPLAMANPRVLVARTFSKVYGLAGLRVGYAVAQPATLAAMERHTLQIGVNQLGAAAALASLGDRDHIQRERARNRDAREFTRSALAAAGYPAGVSDANFIMVDVRRDTKQFAAACRDHGVLVGRPFPPLSSYSRISVGTADEMRTAVDVFRRVLATA
jgi:histidinol-phosphate aminotransferase